MKKVLIIGPRFFYFNDSVASAFRQLGWDAKICAFDTPVHPYNGKNKIKYKLARNKEALKESGRRFFSDEVKRQYDDYAPDLLFLMNGDALLPETTKYFSERSKVAIWCFDSIVKFPAIKRNIPFAHAVFCYEYSDIELLKKGGVEAHFLPQAADLGRYYMMKGEPKQYDIVFAGDIWQSEKRKRILRKVVEKFSDRRICVWGIYKPWYKGLWSYLTRERRDIYMNCNTDSETLNLCYNRSRIVLNIHNEQQKNGANPKVYEISASGAYQLCDANPYIESLFPHGELGLYHTDDECLDLIERILSSDEPKSGEEAYRLVVKEHSFESRMRTVLEVLDLL